MAESKSCRIQGFKSRNQIEFFTTSTDKYIVFYVVKVIMNKKIISLHFKN